MVALTASPHSALPPSWDETIVPSLRKRLETESRILSKRLSTISITDEPGSPQDLHRTASPSQNQFGDYADTYPARPSAIPRPSYSRAGERAAVSPEPPPQAAEPPRKPATKRQRTQSTPFPFDHPASSGSVIPPLPNGHHANGMPTSSPSGSISPRVQSPPLGGRSTPSRIPTVASRVRSGSQSSQGFGSLNPAKSSLPPSHKFSPTETSPLENERSEYFTPDASLRVKGSSATLARQRIVDEKAPFTNDPPPHELEREFTGRPLAEEERAFQHWYRGDVSRNGGVGEYRVGKRMEMLDIANYGHALRAPAGRTRAHEEPTPRSEGIGVGPRKRAESVSSRERASIYIDPQDETVTGRVLDEMPLTDIEAEETDHERDYYAYTYQPQQTEFGVQQQQQQEQVLSTNHNRPHVELPSTLPNRLPSNKSHTRIPQSQPRKVSAPAAPPTASASETSKPTKSNQRDRGRAPAAVNTRSKTGAKTKGQKRSKSAADALRPSPEKQESTDYAGLADAVPETSSPLPRNGNWDEVILPTVARRMGIEYEKETPEAAAKRRARESRVPPAPGTFGYDYNKYKPPRPDEEVPMDEFGQRPSNFAPEHPEEEQQLPSEESSPETAPRAVRPRRETMPSPAPFSHYANPTDEQSDPARQGRGKRRERQDVPHILVSPPTMDVANGGKPEPYVEEDQNSGCCKCVVM